MVIKKVLYISYDGLTDPLGQSQVLPYLIGLAQKGHQISILSCEKPENYAALENHILNITKTHNILWIPIQYTKKPPVLSTIWDIIRLRRKARKLYQISNFDIIHCRSYIAAMVGLWLKTTTKTKLVFDMRGFWADERVEGNIWDIKQPIYKAIYTFFKRKEQHLLIQADAIVSLTHKAKDIIVSWNLRPNMDKHVHVIPCCADMEHFDYKTLRADLIAERRLELGINENDFVLTYLGAIGTWYLLPEMLDFYKSLLIQFPNAKFLFITHEKPETITALAKEKGINTNNIIITKAARTDVPVFLSLSSYAIFFIKSSFSKSASSPTKMGEIMSMGIPIICNSGVGDVDKVMNESQCGFMLNEMNERSYGKVIEQIKNSEPFIPAHIRNHAIQFFALEKGIEKYDAIYQAL
jgi:glycosyltransferase involved in cell wall biosynthesis